MDRMTTHRCQFCRGSITSGGLIFAGTMNRAAHRDCWRRHQSEQLLQASAPITGEAEVAGRAEEVAAQGSADSPTASSPAGRQRIPTSPRRSTQVPKSPEKPAAKEKK